MILSPFMNNMDDGTLFNTIGLESNDAYLVPLLNDCDC